MNRMADSAASLRAAQARVVPARIGRYEILLPIASGGMATVYLARSIGARGFERRVALKLTHAHLSEEGEWGSITLEEARIASRIRHRNVVSILDVGDDPLGLFLVMEYVEGATLGQLFRAKTPMSKAIGARILLDALAGVHAAHELRGEDGGLLGVVHRDFTPHNILVGLDGVAQLADFGIAKAADRVGHTSTGIIKGKAAYMAPEQVMGIPVDRRADVWSAGTVAWELFAGKRLHGGGEGMATLLRVIREVPPLLRGVNPEVTPEIEAVVARALIPQIGDRTPTAAVFARDLALACAAAGRLATHDEVAEFVKETSRAKLETRRAQVQEVLRLREKMDALAEESITSQPQTGSRMEMSRELRVVSSGHRALAIGAARVEGDTDTLRATPPAGADDADAPHLEPTTEERTVLDKKARPLRRLAVGAALIALGVAALGAWSLHKPEDATAAVLTVAPASPPVAIAVAASPPATEAIASLASPAAVSPAPPSQVTRASSPTATQKRIARETKVDATASPSLSSPSGHKSSRALAPSPYE
jgi:serine/threonine protein kinase